MDIVIQFVREREKKYVANENNQQKSIFTILTQAEHI